MRKLEPKRGSNVGSSKGLLLESLNLNPALSTCNTELFLYALGCPSFCLEMNLQLQVVEEGAEPSWLLFRPSLDVLMTLHLPKTGVWSKKQQTRLMCLPKAFPLFFHCYILSSHLGWSGLNHLSLSKLTIIKFISQVTLLFFLLCTYSRIIRGEVLGQISRIIDICFGRNVKRKRLTPEITEFIGSYNLLQILSFIYSFNRLAQPPLKDMSHVPNFTHLNTDFIFLLANIINLFIVWL